MNDRQNNLDFYGNSNCSNPNNCSGSSAGGAIKTPGALSTSSQTTYEEDDHSAYDWSAAKRGAAAARKNTKENYDGSVLNECKRNLFPADDKASRIKKKEGRDGSPLNTSGSSLTEEIFNTALSNLEFLSDEDSTEGTT